ncbi:uncharacterized protein PG986_003748 [Apiospora aurea]|uniref:Luciferase-like domain-containing protein n=1 Tax=Apiospora aurea TaxID=335848 RepID=A0ABR1QSX9_9PEZI
MASTSTSPGRGSREDSKKQMILNAFVMNTPGHLSLGQWRHPRNKTDQYTKLSFWTDLAKLLDEAGFHAMFIADTLGRYDVHKGPAKAVPALGSGAQFSVNDPLYLVPSMAAATRRLVFGVTASVTYEKPYSLARHLSTLDHLSEGCFAWNIVTSYLDSAARNIGLSEQIPHDERYAIAHEYMGVMYKLWEGSFRDDAVVADRETGVYIQPDARTPLLFQAGVSEAGNGFGGKHGEAIFVGGQTPEPTRIVVDNLRAVAAAEGRRPEHVKILVAMTVIVAATDEEVERTRQDHLKYVDEEGALALFVGWTGIDLAGYPDDADFSLLSEAPRVQSVVRQWSATVPGTEDLPWAKRHIVEYLSLGGLMAKALRRYYRVFIAGAAGEGALQRSWRWVGGVTAREVFFGLKRLPDDHPGSHYKWRAGEEIPAYQEK